MKRSASKAELSFDEEEPLDVVGVAVEPTQGLELEPQRVQDRGNDGEGSILSSEAGLGLESCSFEDVARDAIQANRGFAVQPTEVGLEKPNVEALANQASSGVAVQLTQAGLGLESQNLQEQPNIEERVALPSPLIRGNDRLQTLIDDAMCLIGACRQLARRCTDNLVPQTPPSNIEERVGLPNPLIRGNDSLQTLKDEAMCLIGACRQFIRRCTNNLVPQTPYWNIEERVALPSPLIRGNDRRQTLIEEVMCLIEACRQFAGVSRDWLGTSSCST